MKIEHLPLLKSVSAPTVHPDGLRAVVSVTRADFDGDAYVGQLWNIPLAGEGQQTMPARRITRGFHDSAPLFSPNGSVLAFLRSEPGKPAQLCIVDADGGEPLTITDRKLGVGSFDWSPDSHRIVFSARVPEEGRYGTLEGVSAGAEDPRHITGLKFRMNGLGYTADKRAQLFLLDVPAVDAEPAVSPVGRARKLPEGTAKDADFPIVPQARQLTSADADHSAPRFTRDGTRILFSAELHPGADRDLVSDV
ncbi:TolB family protein [Paenarthrobacter sp. Z7-10]|uniref:TolB family protein n=1 Tax=Paenarthrobacter sp. Z7-10 TaxID=2787635 RepID=UPI002E764339|nr:hypothetical protein [Paenarthrobacter sp. Z7-10]